MSASPKWKTYFLLDLLVSFAARSVVGFLILIFLVLSGVITAIARSPRRNK